MMVEFDTVLEARLDRLLDALLDPLNKPQEPVDSHRVALSAASSLQKQWRFRFKDRYLELKGIRRRALLSTGRLRDVSFIPAPAGGGAARWEVVPGAPIPDLDGAAQFEPG